jgi:hypothetical protein
VAQQQQKTVTNNNTNIITDYLQAMQTEINSSKNYSRLNKWILTKLSKVHEDKPFALLEKGPNVLNVKGMEEKVEDIRSQRISQ